MSFSPILSCKSLWRHLGRVRKEGETRTIIRFQTNPLIE